jgi:hypothetical protein
MDTPTPLNVPPDTLGEGNGALKRLPIAYGVHVDEELG